MALNGGELSRKIEAYELIMTKTSDNFDVFSISEQIYKLQVSECLAHFGRTGLRKAIPKVSASNFGTEKLTRLEATKYMY